MVWLGGMGETETLSKKRAGVPVENSVACDFGCLIGAVFEF
jgi:hypothetical protein